MSAIKHIGDLLRGRIHKSIFLLAKETRKIMATNQEQEAALQSAIADLKSSILKETTEINTKLDALQAKIDAAGAPIDLSDEIASIREAAGNVEVMVQPVATEETVDETTVDETTG